MKLVVTEKNDAAVKIADLLGASKPKADKVFNTPVYRFEVEGEEWVTIGLRGHILEPDFTPSLTYKKRGGWEGVTAEGEMLPAVVPDSLAKPPFKKKKPFTADGVEMCIRDRNLGLRYLRGGRVRRTCAEFTRLCR